MYGILLHVNAVMPSILLSGRLCFEYSGFDLPSSEYCSCALQHLFIQAFREDDSKSLKE